MEISLSLFYYIYIFLAGIFILFSFFNIYHLIAFGAVNSTIATVIIFYLFCAILIFAVSWHYILQVDWGQSIEIIPTISTELNFFN